MIYFLVCPAVSNASVPGDQTMLGLASLLGAIREGKVIKDSEYQHIHWKHFKACIEIRQDRMQKRKKKKTTIKEKSWVCMFGILLITDYSY